MMEIAGKTDPGSVRENNEDSLAIDLELGLMVVADGMGGHNAGEVASRIAVETVLEYAQRMLKAKPMMVPPGRRELSVRGRQLEHFLNAANTVIYEKARAVPQDQGMGTTVVAVLADRSSFTVAHVGDSRLYLYSRGSLKAITQDHSLVQDQIRSGLITTEQASHSLIQNILTRALGTEKNVRVDVADHELEAGDVLVLASDGLTKMLSDSEIADAVAQNTAPAAVVNRLIALSLKAGGHDNVTIVAARAAPDHTLRDFVSNIWRTS